MFKNDMQQTSGPLFIYPDLQSNSQKKKAEREELYYALPSSQMRKTWLYSLEYLLIMWMYLHI